MNDELFNELLESVREGGLNLRGEIAPTRTFAPDAPDIKQIREDFSLSQSEFAAVLGISVKTLQNWEQGRWTPPGLAQLHLQVVELYPDAVWVLFVPNCASESDNCRNRNRVSNYLL
jgi:putative transcriptional regulator